MSGTPAAARRPGGSAARPPLRGTARRVRQHFVLCLLSVILTGVAYAATMYSPDQLYRISMATAYSSMALLVYVLTLGPLNVIRGRPNPVSTNLRRDAGIWAAILALLHVAVGLFVHMRGKMYQYFFYERAKWSGFPRPRFDLFGFCNDTGLAATLILILLLALSNDLSLRKLGSARWKSLQRTNYYGMGLIALHGAAYQYATNRPLGFVAVFGALIVIGVAWQVAGIRRVSRAG